MEKLEKMFSDKPKLRDFSYFFNNALPEEQQILMEGVVRKANKDQRELVEQHHQAHQKPA